VGAVSGNFYKSFVIHWNWLMSRKETSERTLDFWTIKDNSKASISHLKV
jgi:hypothetical protein